MTTPRKAAAEKADAKKPRAQDARPGDDPIAALSAERAPDYEFTFDTPGLAAAVQAGPDKKAAAEVFAAEVTTCMQEASAERLKKIDPVFITTIIQVVLAIVAGCKKPTVQQTLTVCRDRPRSLQARFTRLALARRLPGHWLHDALEAARAMIEAGIKNLETDLFHILFPDPEPAPAPAPAPTPEPAPAPAP